MEKELIASVDQAVNEVASATKTQPLKAVEQSIADQIGRMESIERSLRARIRQERLAMQHEYEHRVMQVRNDFEQKLDAQLRRMASEFNDRAREHDLLAQRMGI